jgi:DNA-binding NarL/FixJ family response regulator
MTETRVAVIASQPGLSESICEELAMFSDLRAIAADSYLGNIHEFLSTQHPDVIVLEADEARAEGWLALVQVHLSSPSPAVVLLSNHDNREQINVAVQRGASAIVLKLPPAAELADAIRCAVRGEMWLSPPLLTQILTAVPAPPTAWPPARTGPRSVAASATRAAVSAAAHPSALSDDVRCDGGVPGSECGHRLDLDEPWGNCLDGLSSRELAVLELLTEGMEHHEIAFRLGLSSCGVTWHLHQIRQKLRVHSSRVAPPGFGPGNTTDSKIRQLFTRPVSPGTEGPGR